MTATFYKITIEQGATFETSLTMTGRDLTDCSARMQIRETVTSPTALMALTSSPAAGITITPGPPGLIDIVISATQTATLAWKTGVYDLELVSPDGTVVERLLKGDVVVDPEVTR